MKNILTIKTLSDNKVQTDIVTIDGSSCMEIHRAGLYESKVLEELLLRKYFQHCKGDWQISFSDDNWISTKPSFEEAIEEAQLHIFSRDNSISYGSFG